MGLSERPEEDNDGKAIPVTVVEAGPCRVIQKKNPEK